MMNPQKQITTNAPSIRYEGDLRPEQAGIMQKQAQAMQQMQQQAMMQQQQQGMMQPQMGQPQMPQPQGRMPAGRMPAASGGIMDMFNNPNMADIAGPSDTGNAMDSNMIVVADLMKDLQRTDLTDMERAIAQEKLKAYGSQEQVDSLMGNKNYMEALIEQMQQQGLSKEEMIQEIMGMQSRENKAYGGIMGMDGRKQYGIGSWFQEKIMDPIKKNPMISAAAAALAYDQFGIPTGGGKKIGGNQNAKNFISNLFKNKPTYTTGNKQTGTGQGDYDIYGDKMPETSGGGKTSGFLSGLGSIGGELLANKGMLSAIGGLTAGIFSDKLNPPDEEGNIDYGAGIGINNVGKAANLLSPEQGMEAGLRFLPELSTRKYSPAMMAAQYGDDSAEPIATANLAGGGISQMGIPNYEQQMMNPDMMEQIRMLVEGMQAQGMNKESMEQAVRMQVPDMSADMSMGYAEGGPSGEMGTVMEEGEEMLDMGGMEKDYREEGGFVPIGEYEKKDDVPARLSVNEFVFTADAVRGAGDGDIDKGAERLQGIMKQLEQQGRPEGMEMMEVSERLSEVV